MMALLLAARIVLFLSIRSILSIGVQSEKACKVPEEEMHQDKRGVGSVPELMLGDEGGKASDYANYFVSYAYLYHQKQMLTDGRRMHAYRQAILKNSELFKDKVVLDVGAGSGILSIWAAQAGAKKVYAVEFTSMATHAETLVKFNGMQDIVQVYKGAVESMELEKDSIDIIVSEWMGYFLLRESMLDSVLFARDKFLKPNGAILPNRAHLYWAPANLQEERDSKLDEMAETLADFEAFVQTLKEEHGVDAACLRLAYEQEQQEYYMKQAAWIELDPQRLLAPEQLVASFDLYTITPEQVRGVDKAPFNFAHLSLDQVSSFIGWFSVDFDTDGDGNSFAYPVLLSTAPEQGYTHWGQQAFFLSSDVDHHSFFPTTQGTLSLIRKQDAVRLYTIVVDIENPHTGATKKLVWDLT
mmetsp:Transcript_17517/g.22842  ORF Transcript_17517/g.22842 Transcript_17517/m.22842 type:complete len:413 (-) Transcript_17517:2157-3395(-)